MNAAEFAINDGSQVNRVGLSRKHMFDAVERSVQHLGTYIDVLQTRRLDRETPMEEIMKALNDVIEGVSVRYISGSSVRWLLLPTSIHPPIPTYLSCPQFAVDKSANTLADGSLGIPNAPKHRSAAQLAQIHLHAGSPQPALPLGRARNDSLLPRHGRRAPPLVAARGQSADSCLERSHRRPGVVGCLS